MKKTGRGVGRPRALSQAGGKKICELLRKGNTLKVSAAAAGVSYATFRKWFKHGQEIAGSEYAKFASDVVKADAEAQELLLAIVFEAAEKGLERVIRRENYDADGNLIGTTKIIERVPLNGQLALRALKLRWPEEYAKQYVEHSGDVPNTSIRIIFDDGENENSRNEPGVIDAVSEQPS